MPIFEHPHVPLLPRRVFLRRWGAYALGAALLTTVSLAVGAIGFHVSEHLGWLDSTYAAAMILTGMGPVFPLQTDAGKVFITVYALFSAAVYLSSATLVISPLFHRIIHRFHLESHGHRPVPPPGRA